MKNDKSLFKELVLKNRSRRRFYGDEKISFETLKELIELARLSLASSNRQPLKFILSNTKEKNEKIFPYIVWARILKKN